MDLPIVYRLGRIQPDPQLEPLGRLVNALQPRPSAGPRVAFLDFDGPLAIPWTVHENPWPWIPQLIREASARPNLLLCIVSFNPGAEAAVTRWGIRDCFVAVRAGCNRRLAPGEVYTEEHRRGLSKPAQIQSILQNELQGSSGQAGFFDDDPQNLWEVHRQFDGQISCFYVHEGLTPELFARFVD